MTLKNILREIAGKIGRVSESTINSVLKDYEPLQGKEEEITAQIRGEINRHLIENIERKLNNAEIHKNCKISVTTFQKIQENHVGADLAIVLDMRIGGKNISKAFLVQAKVAKKNYSHSFGHTHAEVYSPTLINQCENMLKITSDAFVFVYSEKGLYCIPAFQIILNNSPTVKTTEVSFKNTAMFFQNFFDCFIGDHKITPSALNATTLESYAQAVSTNSVLKLEITTNN
jgi:hypothetical protein